MNIFGIGTDIVQISRVQKIVAAYGHKLAKRLLASPEWLVYIQLKPLEQIHYVAKRFAAKEAVAKALGTGFKQGLAFNQIAITNNSTGQPLVSYSAKAQELIDFYTISQTFISLSDEKDCALAFVIMII